MRIVKYIVELSIEEWEASPHIHKHPYDTLGDIVRVMIPKTAYELMFMKGTIETLSILGKTYDVTPVPYTFPDDACNRCCLKGICKMKVPCVTEERLDYQWVYFVPYQENV